MQPSDNMKLPNGNFSSYFRFRPNLLESARVGSIFRGPAREGAKRACFRKNTNIGGVDVLVGCEVDPVSVPLGIHMFGKFTQAQEIVSLKQHYGIGRKQSFSIDHLAGDGLERWIAYPHLTHLFSVAPERQRNVVTSEPEGVREGYLDRLLDFHIGCAV